MVILESYSHFNGLEFLKVRQNDLFDSLRQQVRELDATEFIEPQQDLVLHSEGQSVDRRFRERLRTGGWQCSGIASIKCFIKNKIGLKICFGLKAGDEWAEYCDFCSRYRCDEIDLGIGLFPMESTARHGSDANFRNAVQALRECGRVAVVVPLALFAIGA